MGGVIGTTTVADPRVTGEGRGDGVMDGET